MKSILNKIYQRVVNISLAVVIAFGGLGALIPIALSQEAYAIPAVSSYNGSVSGFVGSIGGLGVAGYTSGAGLNSTFSGFLTESSNPGQKVSFSGTITGDISGTMTGGVNYNGYDTLFAEITGSTASGYVYLLGGFSGPTGNFQGQFITQSTPMNFITAILVTGESSVEVGKTQQMTAVTSPIVSDIAWSVWTNSDDPGHGSATIDETTGLLTATGVGPITVIASALDGSLITQNYNVTVTPDITGPAAPEITSPIDGAYFNNTPMTNQWDPATDVSGVAGYQIAYNYDDGHSFGGTTCPGMTIPGYDGFIGCRDLIGTSRNHTPSTGEQGGVTIWVRAIDNIGNLGGWSSPVHYYYDATVPVTPLLVSPSNNAILNGANVTQSWSTSDTDINHFVYESYNDVGATSLRWSQDYAATNKTATNVANTEYWWRVKAVDNAGNASSWSDLWKITIDNDAPFVSIGSPINSVFNTDVEVRGTVTDSNLRHYWLQVKRNGLVIINKTVMSTGISNELLYTATSDGDYTVTLAARDKVGGGSNTGNRSLDVVKSFTIDTISPDTPTLLTPENNDAINNNNILFDWADISDAVSYEVQFSQSNSADSDGSLDTDVWSGDASHNQPTDSEVMSSFANGIWYWQVRSVDIAGNKSDWSSAWSFIVDTVAPNSFVYGLSDYNNTAVIEIPFSYSDTLTAMSGIALWYRYNQGSWQKYGDFYSSPISFDSSSVNGDGDYDFYTVATDLAGNTETQGSYKIFRKTYFNIEDSAHIDTTDPIIGGVKVTIDYNPFVNGNGFTISSKISGESWTGVKCEYTLDNGASWNNASYILGYCTKINLSASDGQELSINFRATDKSGNTATGESIQRIADESNPNGKALIENEYYGPNTYNDNTIKGTADDSTSGVRAVKLTIQRSSDNKYWNGSQWVSKQLWGLFAPTVSADGISDWSYQLDKSNLTDGVTYTITPKAITDNVFNFATGESDSFVWDETAPTITVTGGDLTIEKGSTYIEQGATWTDNIDGYGDVKNENISGLVDTLISGIYSITYLITDAAGNSTTATRVVTVKDTTAPVITLNGESLEIISVGDSYTELGAITDDGSLVTIAGLVDTSTAGSYVLTYSAVDDEGNIAESITRTITVNAIPVVAVTPPVILAQTNVGGVLGDTDTVTTTTEPTDEEDQVKNEDNGEVKGVVTSEEDSPWYEAKFFGLAWYLWVLILAVLAGLCWWFIAGYLRRREEK